MANQTDPVENVLQNWTKDEKFHLLEALKEIGSQDIKKIAYDYVQTKTVNEIQLALNFYMELAVAKIAPVQKRRQVNTPPSIPLASWAKFISDYHNFDELQTETATALRLIAEFEDRPHKVCTENIDFSKMYYMLADALEGKGLPEDKHIKSVIDKCLVETALTSKAFMRNTTYKQILNSVNIIDKGMSFTPNVTNNKELSNIRHIAIQENYNPLNISEMYLKSSN